jgi:hypothetical protein
MFQEIVIGLIFLAAIGYTIRLIVRSFKGKHACASGCGKCAVTDLDQVGKAIHPRV